MAYKDKNKQKEYGRIWRSKRRKDYFKDKKCVRCGSVERLELDHIDPKTKKSNSIWSWAESKRLEEIAKCQVLCNSCHKKKTKENKEYGKGNPKLNEEQVKEIRYLYSLGNTSYRKLSKIFGIADTKIGCIIRKKYWKDVI